MLIIKLPTTYPKLLLIIIDIFIFTLSFQESKSQFEKNKINDFSKSKEQILQNYGQPYWVTYFGGDSDDIFNFSIMDANNDIIAVGTTTTMNLPVQLSSYQNNLKGLRDIYIAKFDIKGNLIWSTYLGGADVEYVFKIGEDRFGRIWVVGETRSIDFPIYGTTFQQNPGYANGYVACFDSSGKLLLSTVLGGDAYDAFLDLSIKNNFIYIVGRTMSSGFPITNDAFQKYKVGFGYNGVIIKIGLLSFQFYSTYVGIDPSGDTFLEGIAIDNDENIIIGGFTNASAFQPSDQFLNKSFQGIFDIWFYKLDKDFNLVWSALYGGSSIDRLSSIQCDSAGNIYILGFTTSSDITFPNAFQNNFKGIVDGLILKLSPDGQLVWGSFVGGSGIEGKPTSAADFDRFFASLFLNEKLNLLAVNFSTGSNDIFMNMNPTPFQSVFNGGSWDSYSLLLDLNGKPIYSTFLGGTLSDFSHSIFIKDTFLITSGSTQSFDFPVTLNAFQRQISDRFDGFIAVFGTHFIIDTLPPQITSSRDSCGIKVVTIEDIPNNDSEIETFDILRMDNCKIEVLERTKKTIKIKIELIDFAKNGYYSFKVIDKSNNTTIVNDSLLGNFSTLVQFYPSPDFFVGDTLFGDILCKDITVRNFSTDTIVISHLFFRQNINFSIPPSQLPLTIPGQDSAKLKICFSAMEPIVGIIRDTLTFFESCYFAQLRVSALLDTGYWDARSNCNVEIRAKSAFEGSKQIISVSAPLPEKILIRIDGKQDDAIATIELFNIFGTQIEHVETANNIIEINTFGLAQGTYFIRIAISDSFYYWKMLVR